MASSRCVQRKILWILRALKDHAPLTNAPCHALVSGSCTDRGLLFVCQVAFIRLVLRICRLFFPLQTRAASNLHDGHCTHRSPRGLRTRPFKLVRRLENLTSPLLSVSMTKAIGQYRPSTHTPERDPSHPAPRLAI